VKSVGVTKKNIEKEGFFAKKPIFKNFKAKRIFLC